MKQKIVSGGVVEEGFLGTNHTRRDFVKRPSSMGHLEDIMTDVYKMQGVKNRYDNFRFAALNKKNIYIPLAFPGDYNGLTLTEPRLHSLEAAAGCNCSKPASSRKRKTDCGINLPDDQLNSASA